MAATAGSVEPSPAKELRNARSQTPMSARPCAILARWATMQGVEASRSLSSVSSVSGSRYPASTYGRDVLAREAMESLRKRWKVEEGDVRDGLLCARYDSSPLEYAKDPSGRAESERRSRACNDERVESSCFLFFLLYVSGEG